MSGIGFSLKKALRGTGGSMSLDVSAVLAGGAFAALYGPSGAGKTTLLRMLAGLARPDAGRLVVDGECWFDADRRIDLPPRHRRIGFVFQDYALFPNLTVRENVAYAVPKEQGGWVDELLALTALSEQRDRLRKELSGGQKQRVALARAIAPKPELLLLDEPLSALDSGLRLQLQDLIADMHRRFGQTTILVSHDIGEVFRLSQHVLRIENGKIVQSGTPDEVFLRQRPDDKIHLRATVLACRREERGNVVSLLIGQDVMEVIAAEGDVASIHVGDVVEVAAKAFSPMVLGALQNDWT